MFYEDDDVMLSIWMDDEVSLNEILFPPLDEEEWYDFDEDEDFEDWSDEE